MISNSRFPESVPYLLLTLGVLFSLSPLLNLGGVSLLPLSPSYVTAGAFCWLYVRGMVRRNSYVLAVPAVTFLILTGMWLYFELSSPYGLSAEGVVSYGSISLFFVLGQTAKKKEWVYFGASGLTYLVCTYTVASGLPGAGWGGVNPVSLGLTLVPVLVPGIPLTVATYLLLRGDPSRKDRVYLGTAVLAYAVWVVVGSGTVQLVLDPRPVFHLLVLVLSLGIPRAVVPRLLPDDASKREERAYLGAAVVAYVLWIPLFTVGVLPVLYSWTGAVVLALTLGAGIPLGVVGYLVPNNGRRQQTVREPGHGN